MLFELSMIPIGRSSHISDEIAEVLEEIEASRLPYRLTPSGTCLEGNWSEVMPVIEKCHYKMRKLAPHVITTIRIEDEVDGQGRGSLLVRQMESLEERTGRFHRKDLPT